MALIWLQHALIETSGKLYYSFSSGALRCGEEIVSQWEGCNTDLDKVSYLSL